MSALIEAPWLVNGGHGASLSVPRAAVFLWQEAPAASAAEKGLGGSAKMGMKASALREKCGFIEIKRIGCENIFLWGISPARRTR